MAKVQIKLNREGVRELLKSEEMMAVCEDHANAALSRLGGGYKASSYVGKNRVNAEISAESIKAKYQNAKHNTILKALG